MSNMAFAVVQHDLDYREYDFSDDGESAERILHIFSNKEDAEKFIDEKVSELETNDMKKVRAARELFEHSTLCYLRDNPIKGSEHHKHVILDHTDDRYREHKKEVRSHNKSIQRFNDARHGNAYAYAVSEIRKAGYNEYMLREEVAKRSNLFFRIDEYPFN